MGTPIYGCAFVPTLHLKVTIILASNTVKSFYLFLTFFFLSQHFTMQLRLALNSQSSCLHLPKAGIIGMYYHTQLIS
jgi:hypothetical protein